jgi:hypothetical protein
MADINLTAPIAQMPNLQGVAGAQAAHPEAQRIFAAELAQQALKEQQKQVQKVEREEEPEAVKRDSERRQGEEPGPHQRKRQAKGGQDEEETGPPNAASAPWVGNLLNKKV